MITKVLQSNDLRATLDYIYQEGKDPMVVDSTCMDDSREGALADIRDYIEQRPEISKPVFHAVLSVPAHEQMDDRTWTEIAKTYTQKMGYGDVPYVAVKHQDTAHQHIHIVASRVTMKGQLISDSFEAYRSQEVARVLEKTHELTRVPSSWEVDRCRARPEELHRAMRLGEPAQRERMHQAIEESLKRTQSVTQFVQALHRHNVRVVPNVTQDDSKVQGISFERDGVKLAGSKIDRQFSWNQLKNRLDYSHARDLETLRRTPEVPSLPGVRDGLSGNHSSAPSSPPERLQRPDTVPSPGPVSSPVPSERVSAPSSPVMAQPRTHAPLPEAPRVPDRDVQRIALALQRAPENQGWKAWSDALKREGVEPVPKVTQQDQSDVKGIYFVSGEAMMPGSKVGRDYSFAHLEARLGTYEPTRDVASFERVMVPGQGLQARTPVLDVPRPSSTFERAQELFAREGARVEMNPKSFEGTWGGVVQDASGTSYAVVRAHALADDAQRSRPVAVIELDASTRYVQARLDAEGFTPQQRLSGTHQFAQGDPVMWRHEAGQRALIQLERAPLSKEVAAPRQDVVAPPAPAPTPLSDERALVARFTKGGYTVELNPEAYAGRWGAVTRSDQGTSYGVLIPEQGGADKHIALVKLADHTRYVEARMQDGQLHPERRLASTSDFTQGESIVWRAEHNQAALIRVSTHSQEPERAPERSAHTVPAPALQSKEEWAAQKIQRGQEVHLLAPREARSGTLLDTSVQLKEGTFHVIKTDQNRLVLIPKQDEHVALKGERVMARMRGDGALDMKPLSRSRDKSMER